MIARRPTIALVLVALAATAWAYGTTLAEVGRRWATDPQYSHGFLVPFFSLYLLWWNRDRLSGGAFQPRWWGAGIVLLAVALRVAGHLLYQPWLDTGSLLVCLAGLAAAAGGRRALAWAAPAVLFLTFMLPLPHRVETALGGTLQRIATEASTYALQTLGVPAVAEGNVILLTDTRLGIVEACSGLAMLMTFFALSAAVAILIQRNPVERAVIVLSAVPIAVAANVVRITATGVLFEAGKGDLARAVFHDVAGWLMMPLALGMLMAELFVLGRSIVPEGTPVRARPGAALA